MNTGINTTIYHSSEMESILSFDSTPPPSWDPLFAVFFSRVCIFFAAVFIGSNFQIYISINLQKTVGKVNVGQKLL